MNAWYEDDDFWINWAPYLFSAARLENTSREVDQIIDLLQIAPPASLLDLCCGVGRHSLEFARRAYTVTGVDRTRAYLERARAQAAAEGLTVEYIEGDARAFRRTGAFDAAISMFTSFSYFEDPDDDLKVARVLHDLLKPGGRLVLDINGKEVIARKFTERIWNRFEDGAFGLEDRKVRDGWDGIDSRWILVRAGKTWEATVSTRMYSGAELTGLLKRAGFRSIRLHGNLAGAPYDQTAERLIAVASK